MASRSSSSAEGKDKRPSRAQGTVCIWPRGVEEQFGISAPTRWRWERQGLLPARDVFLAGRAVGWRPETLERARSGHPAVARS